MAARSSLFASENASINAGVTGSAWVLNLVSAPVLTGFSQAAALLIIASQLPALIGLKGSLSSLWHQPQFDLAGMAFGVVGLVLFVIAPSVDKGSLLQALLLGALFGFVTYSTYDLTNLATLKGWPLLVTIVDLAWGSALGALVSVVTYAIAGKIW